MSARADAACIATPHNHHHYQPSVTSVYAALVPQLAVMARSLVRDLDPQNDLQFLRLRAKEHEIMVYSGTGHIGDAARQRGRRALQQRSARARRAVADWRLSLHCAVAHASDATFTIIVIQDPSAASETVTEVHEAPEQTQR